MKWYRHQFLAICLHPFSFAIILSQIIWLSLYNCCCARKEKKCNFQHLIAVYFGLLANATNQINRYNKEHFVYAPQILCSHFLLPPCTFNWISWQRIVPNVRFNWKWMRDIDVCNRFDVTAAAPIQPNECRFEATEKCNNLTHVDNNIISPSFSLNDKR